MRVRFLLLIILPLALMGAKFAELPRGQHKLGTQGGFFLSEGIYIGGADSGPSSLLKMKLFNNPKNRINKRERFYLQAGDAQGEKGSFPYIHMAVEKSPARLVIDISNTQKTAFGPEELRQAFRRSQFVESLSMTMDPVDQSTNITLNFDSPKKVSAFFSKKRQGVLFFEILDEEKP